MLNLKHVRHPHMTQRNTHEISPCNSESSPRAFSAESTNTCLNARDAPTRYRAIHLHQLTIHEHRHIPGPLLFLPSPPLPPLSVLNSAHSSAHQFWSSRVRASSRRTASMGMRIHCTRRTTSEVVSQPHLSAHAKGNQSALNTILTLL